MMTLYNYKKEVETKLPTRRFVPMKFKEKDFVPKRVLSLQPDS